MELQPYHERVMLEKEELDERRRRLVAFMETAAWQVLDDAERMRLRRQLDIMAQYSAILGARIAAFAQ